MFHGPVGEVEYCGMVEKAVTLSVRTTLCAEAVPVLVRTIVYVSSAPALIGLGEAVLLIDTSLLAFTFILIEQDAVFPQASVAVQVTVVSPSLNTALLSVVPVPVVAPDIVYKSAGIPQLSVAVAFQLVPECT